MSAWLDVDLEVFAANLARIREVAAPARHMLVVKDDAYGHGLARVVERAVAEGVEWFGTFDVPTALAVRRAGGPECRILAWTVYDDADIDRALDASIDLGLGDAFALDAVIHRARLRAARARVHLKIDTGLHRNGFRPEEWTAAVTRVQEAADAVTLTGVWSHISEASDAEDDAARTAFVAAAGEAAAAVSPAPLRHLAASAASFARPEFRFDLVRIGAFAYGIRPDGGPSDEVLGIRPVATLRATVIDAGTEGVTIDVGALDGLDSRLAGLLRVGTPAGERTLRAVDATTATVQGWPDARRGDVVALLGGDAPMTATDAAEALGTIGEQVMLRISPRLPRRYR